MSNANQMDLKHGRSAMWGIEAELLAEICRTPGDHIEIGTLWGASAIIAAQNKPRPAHIFAIDIMQGGYWVNGDPGCEMRVPSAQAILENFTHAGVQDRISLICAPSYPFPLPSRIVDVPAERASTALIDGGHGYDALRNDWISLAQIVDKYIAIHDYGPQHPDVVRYIEEDVLGDNAMFGCWVKTALANSLLVMERI